MEIITFTTVLLILFPPLFSSSIVLITRRITVRTPVTYSIYRDVSLEFARIFRGPRG